MGTLNEGLRILTKIVMILLVVVMNPLYVPDITFRLDVLFEERVSVILNLMKQPTLICLCSPCCLTLIFPSRKKKESLSNPHRRLIYICNNFTGAPNPHKICHKMIHMNAIFYKTEALQSFHVGKPPFWYLGQQKPKIW